MIYLMKKDYICKHKKLVTRFYMKQTEISSFEDLLRKLKTKSNEVTIPNRNCQSEKKVISFKIKNSTLKTNEGLHNSRPLSELL